MFTGASFRADTVTLTVTVSVPPFPSATCTVNASAPFQSAVGVYVNVEGEVPVPLTVAEPCDGPALTDQVSVSPASVSVAFTEGAAQAVGSPSSPC